MKAKGKTKPKLLRSINNVLEFGKHKGKTVQEVMRIDCNWLHWALQNIPDFKLNHNALLLLPPQKTDYYSRLAWDDFDRDMYNNSYDIP